MQFLTDDKTLGAVGAALPKQAAATEFETYANAVTAVADSYAVLAPQYRRGTLQEDGVSALFSVTDGYNPVSAACNALPPG